MQAKVVALHANARHVFSKEDAPRIELVAGYGVRGDAHFGATVQHRSRVARDPHQPNLRQVHLIAEELFDELADKGFEVRAGDLGENITTAGIDLLSLSADTVLKIGEEAVLRVTGLRNPCVQIDRFRKGLMAAVLERTADGELVRKAGVMAIVERGGDVKIGDGIVVVSPRGSRKALSVV